MKNPHELRPLLTDVFSPEDPGDGPGALLQTTLRHVRRKRWRKRATVPALVAVMVGLPLWLHRPLPSVESSPVAETASPVKIVGTLPFSAELHVETRAGLIPVTPTSAGLATVLETGFSPRAWKLIDDQELFALLAGRPALLIKNETGRTELIFPNRADQDQFFAP